MSRYLFTARSARAAKLVPAFVGLASLITGCSKRATEPAPSISGAIVLGTGVTGDASGTQVQLFGANPFAPGATPGRVTTATGSAASATFTFTEAGHGDLYLVAWKDDGDMVLDPGDLRGWYNGAVDGSGNPVAAAVHLVHGQNASITITLALVTAPNPGPAGAGAGDR